MNKLGEMLTQLTELEQAGKSIFDLMRAAGLDPKRGFRGGSWTFVRFDGLDLDKANFAQARLHNASFRGASVRDADFRGADGAAQVRGAPGLFEARNWREALLDPDQRLALSYRAFKRAPVLEPMPIAGFIDEGLIHQGNFVDFMKNSGDYEVAREIYDAMRTHGIPANKFALTALIDMSVGHDTQIDRLYAEACEGRVEIDAVMLCSMADAYQDLAKADGVLKLFKAHGLHPNEAYFNIMIKKSSTRAAADAYLNAMSVADVEPSIITLNTLMLKSKNWADGRAIIDSMTAQGFHLRSWDLNNLLKSATTSLEISATLDLYREHKVPRDVATENIRVNRRKNLKEAIRVVEEAIKAGYEPDRFTQTALMRKTETVEDVCTVMALLRSYKIEVFNDQTLARIVRLSDDPEWSRTRLQGLQMSGASSKEQAKALIIHEIDERNRNRVLAEVFGP